MFARTSAALMSERDQGGTEFEAASQTRLGDFGGWYRPWCGQVRGMA